MTDTKDLHLASGDGPSLILYADGSSPRLVLLTDEPIVLGRDSSCDVVVASQFVSRRHAEIRPRAGSYEIVDVGGRNPVTVNGVRAQPSRLLTTGDVVQLGDVTIEFWDPRKDADATAMLPVPVEASSAGRSRVVKRILDERPVEAPRVILIENLWNATEVGGIASASTTVFGVHRLILEEELRRAGAIQTEVVDDGCTAGFEQPDHAIRCGLEIAERAARYNFEHPSLPLDVRVAVDGQPRQPTERVLTSGALLRANALLARARSLEVLMSEEVARDITDDGTLETRSHGMLAMGDGMTRQVFRAMLVPSATRVSSPRLT